MHIIPSPYYSFGILFFKFNSMWLPTKPNIVTSMELTHRVDLKVHAHIFFTIFKKKKKNSPSNLNWCGFQRNRNKYGTLVLASIHSMLISHWDLRPIDVVIITTLTVVVNYILWTKCTFWYKYECPIFYLILVTKKMIRIGVNYYNRWVLSYRVLMPTHVISDQTPTAAILVI